LLETTHKEETIMQRPTGVTILAVLAIIGGVLGILGGLALIALGSINVLFAILGILLLIQSIASLAFGIGAWQLKAWAWQLGVAIEIARIVLSVLSILVGATSFTSEIVGIIIAAIIIYYLYQPEIKSAFNRA
jgi:uncharacterized membrane protein YfcA